MRHNNNIDLIRLSLALLVVGQHLRDLTDVQVIRDLFALCSGLFAVQAFFVISGFLVIQSFENTGNIKLYTIKRVRRIYPAYSVVVLGSFLVGCVVTQMPVGEFLSSPKTSAYLFSNLLFLNFIQDSLPGVFAGNKVHSINGSLWTIKIEVMFYSVVPIISYFVRRYSSHLILCVLFLASILYRWIFSAVFPNENIAKQLPGQLLFFCVGAWVYYNKNWFIAKGLLMGILGVGLMLSSELTVGIATRAIGIGFVIMYVGLSVRHLGNWSRYGDLSYGIYIFHYPIIQLFSHAGVFNQHPFIGLSLVFLLVIFAAMVSWCFVEKKFLYRSF